MGLMSLPYWQKFVFFIAAEKALIFAREVIAALLPDEPVDVTRIEDFNAVVVRQLLAKYKKPEKEIPYDQDEICTYKAVGADEDLTWTLTNDAGLQRTVEVGV